VAADHAGARAGHVQQNAVERAAVPPARGIARIRDPTVRDEAETREILIDALRAGGIPLEGDELDRGFRLQQMAGLATRGGTGIQDLMPGRGATRRAASCAAASCTDTSPTSNPGICCTSTGTSSRTASGANAARR
jgi:hypothetical protein